MPLDIHPALWVIKQIHHKLSGADNLINLRCIHNAEPVTNPQTGRTEKHTEVAYNITTTIAGLRERWDTELLPELLRQNSQGKLANVYYTVNPLKTLGHKKECFAGFSALFLDCDDNKSYTKEQRWAQIKYWEKLGFAPSFVIDSGHGYHVYWLLTRQLTTEEGETLLKRMVLLSGCRDKGNTYDVSRVLRLPGFMNVKEWYKNDAPPCFIAAPMDWNERSEAIAYNPEIFDLFPPSELQDLQRYYTEAQKNAKTPEELETNIRNILKAVKAVATQEAMRQHVHAGVAQSFDHVATETAKPFEPTLTKVPMMSDIKWPRGQNWMKKYCIHGHDGLTQGEMDELKTKHGMEDVSASALDFKIVYELFKKGYTKEAIREFWIRTELKLYRPDKEAKSTEYFDKTCQTALEFVQAAKSQIVPGQTGTAQIFATGGKMWIKTEKSLECLITAEMEVKGIFNDKDAILPKDREWYAVAVKVSRNGSGMSTYNMSIPNSAFGSCSEMKKYSHDKFRIPTNNNGHLQLLAENLLSDENLPRFGFHSKVLYEDNAFLFPAFTIHKTGFDTQADAFALSKELEKHVPLRKHFKCKIIPREELAAKIREFWPHVLKMHLPRVVCATLGHLVAAGIRPIVEEAGVDTFYIPIVNIRGASTTAKTETVKHLSTITGVDRNNVIGSAKTTAFALTKLIQNTNFLPTIVDEFKESDLKDQQLAVVRDLVRRIYSGETMHRGQPNLTTVEIPVKGAMLVIGESQLERTGDVSEVSRVFPVETDAYDPTENEEHWNCLQDVAWYDMAPHLYQFLLQQDIQAVIKEYRDLKKEIKDQIKSHFSHEVSRISHNLAVLHIGCRLMDRFILSLVPEAPTIQATCNPDECLTKYICEHVKESGHTLQMVVQNKDGTTTTINMAKNELLTMIQTYGSLIAMHHELIAARNMQFTHFQNTVQNVLLLNLQQVHETFIEHCNKYKLQVPHGGNKYRVLLTAMIKKHPALFNTVHSHNRHHGNTQVRVFSMNLKLLQSMGIWPEGMPDSETVAENLPHATNRIQGHLGFN